MRKQLPSYVRFTRTWGNKRGLGKYWKRRLSKARRRAWKLGLENKPIHFLSGIESTVNWKTW